MNINYNNFYEMFEHAYKKCKSKKDYKKLCKKMLKQFDVVDGVTDAQTRILTHMLGEDKYLSIIALSIKLYLLELQGIPYDIVSIERNLEDLD